MEIKANLGSLKNCEKALGSLLSGELKMKPSHFFKIKSWVTSEISPNLTTFAEAHVNIFKDLGIEQDEEGAYKVEQDDENFEAVNEAYVNLVTTEVTLKPFPIDPEEFAEGLDAFEGNTVTSDVFDAILFLREGIKED